MTQIKKLAWYGSSVALAAVLAVALLVTGPIGTASAAAPTLSPAAGTEVQADNLSTSTITVGHWEGTDATDATAVAVASGDVCNFSVGGSGATFANGSTVYTYVTSTTNCSAKLKSSKAGTFSVALTGIDVSTGRSEVADDGDNTAISGSISVVFVGAPSASDSDTLFAVGNANVKNQSTAVTVASGDAVTFHIEDSGDREVANSLYTLTVTGGATFSATGTATSTGLTSAAGEIGTATNLTLPSGAFSGTITLEIAAKTGTITLSSPIVRAGPAQASTFAITASLKNADGRVALDDQDGSTTVGNVTTKDGAGTKVDPTGAASVSCTGKDADGANLITAATITVAGSDGVSPIAIDPADTKGGIATCTWKLAAVTGTNAEPAQSGTFEVVVSIATIASVVVTVPSEVTPGTPVQVIVDILDAKGNPVKTGAPAHTVTIAVNGTLGGNLIVGGSAVAHTNGRVTATFIPGDTLGNFTITAVTATSNKSGFAVVKVAKATPPPPAGAGSFAGDIAPSGVSTVIFGSGDLASLAAAAKAAGATSVSVFIGGMSYTHVVGAPAFVNAAFAAKFPDGVPANQIVLLAIVN